jgi:hypothetical protein
MTVPTELLDFEQLERDGFAVLRALVTPEERANFEADIARVADALAAQWNVERRTDETIADVLTAAGPHRTMLFDHIKRLHSVSRLSVRIAETLENAGLFRRSDIKVPIVWPSLRADLPGETSYELPLHQDYATTRCRTAWRAWIPFRDVDHHHGSMEISPGSHVRKFEYVVDQPGVLPFIHRRELKECGLTLRTLELSAGDGVLFNPWIVHGSIANRSNRVKWVLLLHIQDLAAFVNPSDPADPVFPFLELTKRNRAVQPTVGTSA